VSIRHSQYLRAEHDFYCEPAWSVDVLLNRIPLHAGLHDPCCGIGPSLPPGDLLLALGESCRKNGSTDFAWIVFRPGSVAESAEIDWLLGPPP
jgi:hypothetical protein